MLMNVNTYNSDISSISTVEPVKKAIGFFAIAIVIIVFIIVCILIGNFRKKNDDKTMSDIAKKTKEALRQEKTKDEDTGIFCQYCGSQNNTSDFKCASCGAPLHQKKKK